MKTFTPSKPTGRNLWALHPWQVLTAILFVALAIAAPAEFCIASANDGPPTSTAASQLQPHSYQDILFLGVNRPIVIRLHLMVDGRPFVDTWETHARQLFALADTNSDGVLGPDEIESPAESSEVLRDELVAVLITPGFQQADLRPPDGSISYEEFAAFVRQHRGGPFQPPPTVASTVDYVTRAMNPIQANSPGRILFEALDLDDNNRISGEELAAGPESIGKFDFDGDGASSLEEIDHLQGAFGRTDGSSDAALDVPLRVLSSTISTSEQIDVVMAAYGGAELRSAESIAITRLGFEQGELADFDADGNERLDRDELGYWLTHPQPHVELIIRIGDFESDQEQVTAITAPTLPELKVQSTEAGLFNVVAGDVHLELSVAPDRRDVDSVKAMIAAAFQRTDRDGNGYLDRDEVVNDGVFGESFNRFDRDGDGKMFEEEMLTVVEGQITTGLSRTAMTAANRGKDLFEILDVNRDRRVSRRELLAARDRFGLWDVDSDGRLAEREVPQLYQLVFDRGTPQLGGLNFNSRPSTPPIAGTASPAADSMSPLWFRKMDRNADGDVSRREFLGAPAQFQTLDSDGNELIDSIEAAAAASAE